jgi:hypothetical protein
MMVLIATSLSNLNDGAQRQIREHLERELLEVYGLHTLPTGGGPGEPIGADPDAIGEDGELYHAVPKSVCHENSVARLRARLQALF